MPIYLFGLDQSPLIAAAPAWAAFFIIHFLVYPASHAFNTWYDQDKGAIGGIEHPPPIHKSLLAAAWVLDALALTASWFLGSVFFVAMVLYTLGSKTYSWKVTRLKKRPWGGWLGVGIVQGSVTFLAVVQGLGHPRPWSDPWLWAGAATAAVFLWGVYPLTQIYQHEEDSQHGDLTLSRRLGIRGTFVFSGVFLTVAVSAFVVLFWHQAGAFKAARFLGLQLPAAVFFLIWFFQTWNHPERANFRRTMLMNVLASGLMNVVFLLDFWP